MAGTQEMSPLGWRTLLGCTKRERDVIKRYTACMYSSSGSPQHTYLTPDVNIA